MPWKISDVAREALALLDNAEDLCVYSEQRPLAADVVRACRICLSASKAFEDTGFLDALEHGVVGKMRDELMGMFNAARKAILSRDYASERESLRL